MDNIIWTIWIDFVFFTGPVRQCNAPGASVQYSTVQCSQLAVLHQLIW